MTTRLIQYTGLLTVTALHIRGGLKDSLNRNWNEKQLGVLYQNSNSSSKAPRAAKRRRLFGTVAAPKPPIPPPPIIKRLAFGLGFKNPNALFPRPGAGRAGFFSSSSLSAFFCFPFFFGVSASSVSLSAFFFSFFFLSAALLSSEGVLTSTSAPPSFFDNSFKYLTTLSLLYFLASALDQSRVKALEKCWTYLSLLLELSSPSACR
mmetsp:Transcript_72024/g.126923  ORF Transcript_72024/g.126923 Transcript_72024/m.126923 type:complete len:206 (+) Transcript_72024:132-749(+)